MDDEEHWLIPSSSLSPSLTVDLFRTAAPVVPISVKVFAEHAEEQNLCFTYDSRLGVFSLYQRSQSRGPPHIFVYNFFDVTLFFDQEQKQFKYSQIKYGLRYKCNVFRN